MLFKMAENNSPVLTVCACTNEFVNLPDCDTMHNISHFADINEVSFQYLCSVQHPGYPDLVINQELILPSIIVNIGNYKLTHHLMTKCYFAR